MTNIVLPIKDLRFSVERPIVFDIVKQLMDITEISSKTSVRIFDDDPRALQRSEDINGSQAELNNWPFDDKVTVEVTEDFEPDRILSTSVKSPENLIIFSDPNLGVAIKPVYGISNVIITVKYKATDKNKANTWRNTIKTKTSMGRDVNLHNLTYSYHLPEECLYALKEIHRLREKQAGYSETFDEYFTSHITSRASTVSNMSGEFANWVIAEKQMRIQGLFDFQGVPDKPEKEGDLSAYTTTFTYKFSYDKPIHCVMIYPIMVHNQLMNRRFRLDKAYTIEDQNKSYSLSALNFSKFEDGNEILKAIGNRGLDIPDFDTDFYPNSIPSGTSRVFTVLCRITNDNKKFLFNLKDLGSFSLDSEVLDFINYDKDFITKSYASILSLHLYENQNLKQSGSLIIDNDLNVSSVDDLNLRNIYRVRLGLVVNIHLLNEVVLSRIKSYNINNKSFCKKLIKSISSILRDIGGDSDIRSNNLSQADLIKLGFMDSPFSLFSMKPATDPLYDPDSIKQHLVQNFFVVSEDLNKEN